MKVCNKCLQNLPEESFHKRTSKSGRIARQPTCKSCKKDISRKRYTEKKSHILQVNREWRDVNTQRKRDIYKAWVENNPNIAAYYQALHRARKENLLPPWTSEVDLQAIREFYRNCPDGYQVDHIIPRNGKNVRGLHVLSNLQYLTPQENYSKSNKLTV